MGRRSEQRIVILIPVTIRGTDAHGNPFEMKADTCDISATGARLRGVPEGAAPGKKIEVDCKGKKAWYRIEWVGKPRTLSANQIGIQLLEPDKYIWGVPPKEWAPDSFEQPPTSDYDRSSLPAPSQKTSQAPYATEERRRFPRTPYRAEAQITTLDSSTKQPGTITDISLGGCYVEMLGPLPVDTGVEIDFSVGDTSLHLSGTVRSSQVGFGMGIEFTGMSPLNYEILRRIAPPVATTSAPARGASRPPMQQPKPTAPRVSYESSPMVEGASNQLTTTAEALEAVMRVLFRRGVLTRTEFEQEIEALKAPKIGSFR